MNAKIAPDRAMVLIFDPEHGWSAVYATGPIGHSQPGNHGCILGRIGDARILCEYTDPPNFTRPAGEGDNASPPS